MPWAVSKNSPKRLELKSVSKFSGYLPLGTLAVPPWIFEKNQN
jgi:hypothetical protein